MSSEPDPEVIADLKLRAHTEYDRSRTRSTVNAMGASGGIEETVATWDCVVPACRAPVPVTQTAIDTLAQFNGPAYETAREGRPIKTNGIVFCPSCIDLRKAAREKAQDTRRYEMSKAIKLLKEQKHPRDATAIVETLKKLKHPDVPGLIEAIETRQKLPGAKRVSKGDV